MPESLHCIVEVPKGTRNKYEWDPDWSAIRLDRFLFSSVVYPTDYGFFPKTLATDGDPLDAMIAVSEATFPGCAIEIRPIAVLRMHDEAGEDDKVLGVPLRDPNWSGIERLEDLPSQLCDEIVHFFSIYKQPEGKHVELDGWYPREDAVRLIREARERFEMAQTTSA
jgi:inorganic pyrophosphatase